MKERNDVLTGLPGRPELETAIEQAMTETDGVALAMIDIDYFQEVNTKWGHEVGDQLVVQDLCSAAEFALLPDDDLALAELLKSPFLGIDEQAHRGHVRRNQRGQFGGLLEAHEARAGRIEHQPDRIGARLGGGARILRPRNAAHFDARPHCGKPHFASYSMFSR